MSEELKQYISQARKGGMSDELIEGKLLSEGWDEASIKDALQPHDFKPPILLRIISWFLLLSGLLGFLAGVAGLWSALIVGGMLRLLALGIAVTGIIFGGGYMWLAFKIRKLNKRAVSIYVGLYLLSLLQVFLTGFRSLDSLIVALLFQIPSTLAVLYVWNLYRKKSLT